MARHVYLHVPFCSRRCAYCDFAIAVRRDVPVREYLSALEAELSSRFGSSQPSEVNTLYLGGGTPSRLGGEGVAQAIELVRQYFPLTPDGELTIEANPEDVTAASIEAWAQAGVNRLSLGSQSFDDAVLAWMHRTHGGSEIELAVSTARAAGIENISLDLIFALPESVKRDFAADVDRLLALRPQHVSLYGLTIESGTPLGKWVASGITLERVEDGYEEEFLSAHQHLTAAGLEHYEVSNYARPGRRSRHNSSYWSGVPYVGLGPSAHGFDGSIRRWNARNYSAWRDLALSGRDPLEGSELLTDENRIAEEVYLGLRTDTGLVPWPQEESVITSWIHAGWVVRMPDGRIRCTAPGWLRLDALASALTNIRSR